MRKQLLEYRQQRNEFSIASSMNSENNGTITDLQHDFPMRTLRSQGGVADLPNVMGTPLEHKLKRCKLE